MGHRILPSALVRVALGAVAMLSLFLIASLPGSWEVYGAPPLDVTPRGTAPLPPPPGPTPTPPATPTSTPIPLGQGAAAVPTATPPPLSAADAGAIPPTTTSPEAPPSGPPAEPGAPSPISPPPGAAAPATPTEIGKASDSGGATSPPALQPAEGLARPIPTSTTLLVQESAGGELVSGDGSVKVGFPAGFTRTASHLVYEVAILSSRQREAATAQNLLWTNVAFSLHLDPATVPVQQFSIYTRYFPQQTQGIEESSLALYYFDGQQEQWSVLEDCSLVRDQRAVQCRSRQMGTFLLAGALTPQEAGDSSPGWTLGIVLGGVFVIVLGGLGWRFGPWGKPGHKTA